MTSQQKDTYNPLNLTTRYKWLPGDTLMLIALKYRRPGQWLELLDLNKMVLMNNQYQMREGDVIDIPEDWFPLPEPVSFTTKFKGSSGTRVVSNA